MLSAVSGKFRAWSRAEANCNGSRTVLKSTKSAPSANWLAISAAVCRAKRVLPIPGGPVRVSKRMSGLLSSCHKMATSCSRPNRLVSGVGKLGDGVGGRGSRSAAAAVVMVWVWVRFRVTGGASLASPRPTAAKAISRATHSGSPSNCKAGTNRAKIMFASGKRSFRSMRLR